MSSVMIKLNFGYCKLLRQYCSSGKWSVPRELLSTSVSKVQETKNDHRSTAMKKLLRKRFPNAENITVTDLSGNCGSMYEVIVVSNEFKELPLVKQHMLVTEVLSKDIKNMHGIRIETQVPEAAKKSPPK